MPAYLQGPRYKTTVDAGSNASKSPVPNIALLPVFQLSSYRTGSTWLWQKMRGLTNTLAYYEIFHESLPHLTVERAKEVTYDIWPSRHPPMNAYFLEFVPLIGAGGGVVGYDTEAVRAGFIPRDGPDGDLSQTEKAYVDRLISDAWSKRKRPFLSCTGSLGRARAFQQAYRGNAILLHRNLFHQFMSCCSLVEAGVSFFDHFVQPFRSAAHDPFIRDIAIWFGIDKAVEPKRDTLLPAFILLHLYLYAIAYDHADVVVGVTEIAVDKSARQRAEHELSGLMGYEIDLSDVKKESEPRALFDAPPRLRETVEQLAKLIPGTLMSEEASLFVEQACQSALAEWERYDFYTRSVRTFLVGKIANAEAKLAEAQADNDRLAVDLGDLRQRSADQNDIVRTFADEDRKLRDALGAATVENHASAQRVSKTERELAEACAQIGVVAAERDAALTTVAETSAQRDDLQRALVEERSRGLISLLKRIRNRSPTRS